MPRPSKKPYKSKFFIERTDINEFLVDDRAIGDIYNQTLMNLSSISAALQPLDLFNDADDKRYRGFARRYARTADDDFDGDEEFQKAAAYLRNYKTL